MKHCFDCGRWTKNLKLPAGLTHDYVCGYCGVTGRIIAAHDTCKWWSEPGQAPNPPGRGEGDVSRLFR